MIVINSIIEERGILEFLKKRNLVSQYKKAKSNILSGYFTSSDFKLKKPKKDRIWYFRINKQYRALCIYGDQELIVLEIDPH